jgi:hypothetical protein
MQHQLLLARGEPGTGKRIRCNVVCKTSASWVYFEEVEKYETYLNHTTNINRKQLKCDHQTF